MPKKRCVIPLILFVVVASVCFIATMVFTIISAVQLGRLKDYYGSRSSYYSLYEMLPIGTFCVCALLTILIVAPILSVFHLTGALDEKNRITFMKVNNISPISPPKKRAVAAMIEAGVIFLSGFMFSIFASAVNGWNRYNWYFFLFSMILVFLYSIMHLAIGCITLSIDDRNMILAFGSTEYYPPQQYQPPYTQPPAYTQQPGYTQPTPFAPNSNYFRQ